MIIKGAMQRDDGEETSWTDEDEKQLRDVLPAMCGLQGEPIS